MHAKHWRFLWIKSGLWDLILAVITQASSGTCIAKTPWLLAGSGDSGGQKMILGAQNLLLLL